MPIPTGRFVPPSSSLYTRHTFVAGTHVLVLPDKRGRSDVDVNPAIYVGITHEVLTGKTVTVQQTLMPQREVLAAVAAGVEDGLIWYDIANLTAHDLQADGAVLFTVLPMVTALLITVDGDIRVEVAI